MDSVFIVNVFELFFLTSYKCYVYLCNKMSRFDTLKSVMPVKSLWSNGNCYIGGWELFLFWTSSGAVIIVLWSITIMSSQPFLAFLQHTALKVTSMGQYNYTLGSWNTWNSLGKKFMNISKHLQMGYYSKFLKCQGYIKTCIKCCRLTHLVLQI